MGQELSKIAKVYDTVAKEYAEKFYGEHEKKPKDQEILRRFAIEMGDKKPVWDLGCGPGQTTKYLRDLGVEICGLDLSEKTIEQARIRYPGIGFRKGNILALEFADNSIAGVVAFYAIVHFTENRQGWHSVRYFACCNRAGYSFSHTILARRRCTSTSFWGRRST